MALSANIYYKFFRKNISKVKFIEKTFKLFINYLRTKNASKILNQINTHKKNINLFLNDYKYSIKFDYRELPQVINLENMILYLKDQNLKGAIVETGTFTGGASAFLLLSALRNLKDFELPNYWGFDSFEGMPTPSEEDENVAFQWIIGKNKEDLKKSSYGLLKGHKVNYANFEVCLNYLRETGYPKSNINLKKGWFQEVLPIYKSQIGDISLLRLDGDLYNSTIVVLNNLYENVINGGVVIIDDYGSFPGCKKAVDQFIFEKNIKTTLHYVDDSIRYFIKPY